ncbi:MAG: alpha/beta fold hydrolase [Actinomycetota bacterium]
METKVIEIGSRPTRLFDAGDGHPVVVLHGWGGRIESMAPVVSCLTSQFRVVALDLPGFGESPVPDGAWGSPDYAEFVRDVLALLDIERAHFVGHSFGAKTAICVAATHGSLVDKLILVGSPGIRRAPSMKVRLKRLASRVGRAAGALGPPGRALRGALYGRLASQDYRDAGPLRPVLVTVVNEDLAPMMSRIHSPTLLVWGTEDDAVPVAQARAMERIIPDAGLVLFEGAGHFAYLDEPDRFCRVMRHFFGSPVD